MKIITSSMKMTKANALVWAKSMGMGYHLPAMEEVAKIPRKAIGGNTYWCSDGELSGGGYPCKRATVFDNSRALYEILMEESQYNAQRHEETISLPPKEAERYAIAIV